MSTAALAVREQPADYMPVMSLPQAEQRHTALVAYVQQRMKLDHDFGIIPGTGEKGKQVLFKPGAEKLCSFFGLRVEDPEIAGHVEDWTGKDHGGEPFFYYLIRQRLTRGGETIASQMGSCNSWETKYRYRQGERKCPACGQGAIIKGKAEWGGGWVCFKKKGGCGAKFSEGDKAIEGQQVGRVSNPDTADVVNTILKMAQKRALIAATLVAVNASEFFTQDLSEGDEAEAGGRQEEEAQGQAGMMERTAKEIEAHMARTGLDWTWLADKMGFEPGGDWKLLSDQAGMEILGILRGEPAKADKKPAAKTNGHGTMPKTGAELLDRLKAKDKDLANERLHKPGDLLAHVQVEAAKGGHSEPMSQWSVAAVAAAVKLVKPYEEGLRAKAAEGRKEAV